MRLLITGGLGYIGSSLTENLKGYDITVVDNLYTQRYCSLFNRKQDFIFIEKDFNYLTIEFLQQFNYVIHLAAIVDAANSDKQRKIVEQINSQDTLAFIYKCRQANIKLIFPSSTSVYGTSTDIVYEDDNSVLNPQSPYAESKIFIENSMKKITDLQYIVLRFGTVCGISKGMRFQTCINKFCYQAVFNQPLTVWEQNLKLVRPYLSLKDLNKTIQFILDENWEKFNGKTYNILTINSSLEDIIDSVRTNEPSLTIHQVDCPLLNQFSYHVSSNKIKQEGLEFNGDIHTDIKEIINLLKVKK